MKEIEEKLKQFEKKYSLLELTLNSGRATLNSHFADSPEECAIYFPGEKACNVVFQLTKQQMVFKTGSEEAFVVSIVYSLFSSNDQRKEKEIGYYALDVDAAGTVFEEWFVFH